MKKTIGILLLLLLTITACRHKVVKKESIKVTEAQAKKEKAGYPKLISDILEAHGGLDHWRSQRNLVFEMPRADFNEKHTVDLYSRKDRIDTPAYAMGFDGKNIWLLDENGQYEGDPVFYHNLMFYFFAMPFVLADDGIVYGETEDLVFEGVEYPGVRISYNAGVGTSPKDEYFVHCDPKTMQMAWLGYTVTYRTGEKSDNYKWIRYNSWQDVGGIYLPESIIWYDYEGRNLKEPKNSVSFRNVTLSEKSESVDFFNKPEEAEIVPDRKP
ncbi:MAG: DUF6503 family protein [Flavobacteriaceae bacterium]